MWGLRTFSEDHNTGNSVSPSTILKPIICTYRDFTYRDLSHGIIEPIGSADQLGQAPEHVTGVDHPAELITSFQQYPEAI